MRGWNEERDIIERFPVDNLNISLHNLQNEKSHLVNTEMQYWL